LVELLVYGYAGGQVYVAGEVKTPGARAIRGQTSLVQVIEDGGGFTDTARVDAVVVLRRRPNGRVLMHQVDVKAILEGRSDEDMHLLPGDVVFVPRSSIAEVDRIVRQYITGVLPFNIDYQANGAVAGSVIR
jgi:protein involved in polysaccharide export with SLBB domain